MTDQQLVLDILIALTVSKIAWRVIDACWKVFVDDTVRKEREQ